MTTTVNLISLSSQTIHLFDHHTISGIYHGNYGRATIATLKTAEIKTAGAGLNQQAAETPAIIEVKGKGRVIVFSWGVRERGKKVESL
ncbi:MAG: CapA family protein [Xenococcaceae cyanobacterium MO_188.B19]|nr:CapA family protein [Xenococcaceae cyanobacterium MO_188.B19]